MSDKYRFILGSLIVGSLLVLAIAIALGKVEEKTSYGLVPVMTVIAKVALDFSEWAFRGGSDKDKKEEKTVPENNTQKQGGGVQLPPGA